MEIVLFVWPILQIPLGQPVRSSDRSGALGDPSSDLVHVLRSFSIVLNDKGPRRIVTTILQTIIFNAEIRLMLLCHTFSQSQSPSCLYSHTRLSASHGTQENFLGARNIGVFLPSVSINSICWYTHQSAHCRLHSNPWEWPSSLRPTQRTVFEE